MIIKNKKFGFTLAEALMALLVISLITIASIPVITKKKRMVESSVHGKWMCTIDDDGDHIVYGSESNPSGWVKSGSKCRFLVPRDARAFTVSAIGGGGGGAGSSLENERYNGSSGGFDVRKYGRYKFYAIGGGGQGGGWNCTAKKKKWGWGGAAGGVGYGSIDIGEDIIYVRMVEGAGGSGGSWSGGGGGDTVITAVYTNREEEIIRAGGGYGGPKRERAIGGDNSCETNKDGPAPSQGDVVFSNNVISPKKANTSSSNGQKGAYSYIDDSAARSIENFFGHSLNILETLTGRGGSPKHKDSGNEGFKGEAGMVVEVTYAGHGGKAAPDPVVSKFFPSFNKRRFDVIIGQGGKGGAKGQSGSDGTETKVGDFLTVYGGEGGEIYNTTSIQMTSKGTYQGDNGEEGSLYIKGYNSSVPKGGYVSGNNSANGEDATYYGSGGGGAGVKGSTSGSGGDGAPGFVIIEW